MTKQPRATGLLQRGALGIQIGLAVLVDRPAMGSLLGPDLDFA